MSEHHEREPLPPSWFEKNYNLIIVFVVVLAACALAADFIHFFVGHKHIHFGVEGYFGFYALVGFASYVGLVLTAKQLRKILARPADYYDDQPPLLAFDPAAADEVGHGHDEHGHDEHGHDEHGHDEHGHDEHEHEEASS